MFVLRSLFWLTVAFLVIKPQVDIDAGALAGEALAAGTQMARAQVASVECDTLACVGGQAVLTTVLSPASSPVADPMLSIPADLAVPLPRRRPDQAG
jgi:uncharacterized membrane protein